MIAIIDYGVGNINSIVNMFRKVGVAVEVTADPGRIMAASKLVLPGVGAFDAAARRIDQLGLRSLLHRKVIEQRAPLLGICLGMQLLLEESEEGSLPGLGWIKGRVKGFSSLGHSTLKVPHMGWNDVTPVRDDPLLEDFNRDMRFYFVHSYYVECNYPGDVLLMCHYGVDFHAAIRRGNIYGAQFHPEKSHRFGMRFLRNFAMLS